MVYGIKKDILSCSQLLPQKDDHTFRFALKKFATYFYPYALKQEYSFYSSPKATPKGHLLFFWLYLFFAFAVGKLTLNRRQSYLKVLRLRKSKIRSPLWGISCSCLSFAYTPSPSEIEGEGVRQSYLRFRKAKLRSPLLSFAILCLSPKAKART